MKLRLYVISNLYIVISLNASGKDKWNPIICLKLNSRELREKYFQFCQLGTYPLF